MLPNGVFEMLFCIQTLSNICIIRTVSYVSAKAYVIVLPRRWGIRAFSHMIFCPGDRGCSAFLCPRGGDLPSQKNSPGVGQGGVLTAAID